MDLEKFGNRLVYWSLGLEGYKWFGLRHLVELVKDLAIVAIVSGVTVAEEFLSCPLDETYQGVEVREFL